MSMRHAPCVVWVAIGGGSVNRPACGKASEQYLQGASSTEPGICTAQPACRGKGSSGEGEYLTGHNTTSAGKCASHAKCQAGSYLAGSSAVAAGACNVCSNTACAEGTYQTGYALLLKKTEAC